MRIFLMTLALATAIGTMAQQGGHNEKTPAQKAEKRTERMATDLGLDATQKDQVATINLTYANTMKDVDTITDKKAKDKRGDVVKANRDQALKAVLTPEQFNKMNALHAERKAKKDAEKDNGSDD